MATLKERLEEVMHEHGLKTQQQLAEFAGVSKGLVGQWFKGDTGLGAKPLLAFEKKTKFSTRWLVEGKGNKYRDEIVDDDKLTISPAGSIAIQEEVDLSHTHLAIDFYDYKLSAGTGTADWVPNRKESPLVFRKNWFKAKRLNPSDLRAMYIRGDSMSPELRDWDTVIIDITDLEIIDGEIYACVYKEKLYIKRIKRSEDGILLISSNPNYDTMEVNEQSADRFQLLGRMVWRGG